MFTWDISFEAEYVLLSESIERVTQWGRTRYWICSTFLFGHIRWTQHWLACRLFMHHPLFNSAAREKSSVGRVLWFFASEWRENCLFIKFEERWKSYLNFCVCRQTPATHQERFFVHVVSHINYVEQQKQIRLSRLFRRFYYLLKWTIKRLSSQAFFLCHVVEVESRVHKENKTRKKNEENIPNSPWKSH